MGKRKNILAFIIISVMGSLLHFVYDWSGENPIVALFSAVNESVWEHQKLLFVAAAVYSLFEYMIAGRRVYNYPIAAAIGIIAAIVSIITLFYTYSGILGYSVTFIDISLYYIGVFIFLFVRNLIIKNRFFGGGTANTVGYLMIIVLGILFAVWTFYPPKISLFIPKMQ